MNRFAQALPVDFARVTEGNLTDALGREWLETNGLGGYASSTILGLNTRRYHGLLVAATRPPVGRIVMLSKLEETLVIDGRRYELSANRYAGVVHPQGYRYQTGFRLDPFPVFTYRVEGIELEKSVFMPHGENTVCLQYKLRPFRAGTEPDEANSPTDADAANSLTGPHEEPSPSAFGLRRSVRLVVRPLVAFRDYHGLMREGEEGAGPRVLPEAGLVGVVPGGGLPALYFAHDAERLETESYWYRNFEYERERERGFDFTEDLFSPFALGFDLSRGAGASLIASTERRDIEGSAALRQSELERRSRILAAAQPGDGSGLVARSSAPDDLLRALKAAAAQFIVARDTRQTIIAGYHWFSDWGRDTMIALPGLTLATGRADVARSILLEFSRHVDRGMIPNRFPDQGETPDYNTVDATLWFFEAVRALLGYTNDYEFVRADLYEVLADIIRWHVRGTRFNIRVDGDGLLYAGAEGVQLTWMDAKVGDWVVTPRRGKAVEIQALWYNALRLMEGLAARFADEANRKQYAEMAARARESFGPLFWNEEAGCLYDVVDGEEMDASLRPNQIFAVSLPHPLLPEAQAQRVVATVRRELLTPYGLRSLGRDDPRYRGRYEGDSLSRDGAYHQGTVWGWLMGPFITAYVRVNKGSPESRAEALRWLEGFREHLGRAGMGQVSEIFDGDAPHTPRGCIAQAWSVGELLRAALEDVYDAGNA
ncbi:MAG TPA: amylo-alpha-1,6-glucosidase [Pyrinomonadaceae bacterium]|jgi:predicted glycogen debranching enzyme